MPKIWLGILLGIVAMSAVSVRAVSLCDQTDTISSHYCSYSSSTLYLGSGDRLPSFTVPRDGRSLSPISGMSMLGFDANFPGSHSSVASLVKVADTRLPSFAGRQAFGEGGIGGAYGIGTGLLSNFVPDGWYRRPAGDGWGRFQRPLYVGSLVTGDDPISSPLDPTPEPMTLVLFGSGFFLIALLMRRRALAAREES